MKRSVQDMIEPSFYALIVGYLYFHMIPTIGDAIQMKCYSNRHCANMIHSNSFGYPIDLSDNQYREFRASIWLIVLVMVGSKCFQYMITILHSAYTKYSKNNSIKLHFLLKIYHAIFGICFLYIQHKWHLLIVLFIVLLGYVVSNVALIFPRPEFLVWTYALLVMAFKECHRSRWVRKIEIIDAIFDKNRYGGMYAWHLAANFLILRLISFSMDYIRSAKLTGRKEHESQGYSLLDMFTYCAYAPLYIAGPIISFDEFAQSLRIPDHQGVAAYAARWALALGLMEYLLVRLPFFAVVKSGLFAELSPHELAVLCYMTLKMMWIKFLLIWRLFRLWALSDGVAAPENMLRCMSNNHSLEGFWRGWHASFNKWLVKYIYIPLGGNVNKVYSVWIIFFFVAVWHDIELKLILWGIFNSIFLVIENLASRAAKEPLIQNMPEFIKCTLEVLFGALYIFVLITVNMVGYSVGVVGTSDIARTMVSADGWAALTGSYLVLVVGVCIMRYIERWRASMICTDALSCEIEGARCKDD